MDNDYSRSYYILICSYPHLISHKLRPLKASFKAIQDLHFDGLPNKYINYTMTRMQGSQYLMQALDENADKHNSYCVDINTLKANRLELNSGKFINCFIEGEYMLLVGHYESMAIYKDLHNMGIVKFKSNANTSTNYMPVRSRYAQQAGQTVYSLNEGGCLSRIEWQDIKDGMYLKTLVKSNMRHFYADIGLGLATVNVHGSLSLAGGIEVDLTTKVDSKAKWTIMTCIAECWIVSGEYDGQAIMASICKKGAIKSTLKLKLTSNGYKNRDGRKYGGIFKLHNAFVRGRRGIMLVIESDGCCHLISVAYGRMSKLQSIDSIVPDLMKIKSDRIVHSVIATGIEGEFIAGGQNWTRRVSLKLK